MKFKELQLWKKISLNQSKCSKTSSKYWSSVDLI